MTSLRLKCLPMIVLPVAGEELIKAHAICVLVPHYTFNSCRKCRETPRCNYFTIDPSVSMCYLKYANSVILENKQLISGELITAE